MTQEQARAAGLMKSRSKRVVELKNLQAAVVALYDRAVELDCNNTIRNQLHLLATIAIQRSIDKTKAGCEFNREGVAAKDFD